MFEKQFISKDIKLIAGTDEVGRGPLAGPVVSSCAVATANLKDLKKLTSYLRSIGVTDSKKLSDKKREKILELLSVKLDRKRMWKGEISGVEVSIAVDQKSPKIIDQVNILQASLISMRDSYKKVKTQKETVVLIDGNKLFKDLKNTQLISVIKGDSKSSLIGLASIVAKVYRDKLMKRMAKKYPHYSFEKNAGYPTKAHRDAIAVHGITPIHRLTFGGVKEYIVQK